MSVRLSTITHCYLTNKAKNILTVFKSILGNPHYYEISSFGDKSLLVGVLRVSRKKLKFFLGFTVRTPRFTITFIFILHFNSEKWCLTLIDSWSMVWSGFWLGLAKVSWSLRTNDTEPQRSRAHICTCSELHKWVTNREMSEESPLASVRLQQRARLVEEMVDVVLW